VEVRLAASAIGGEIDVLRAATHGEIDTALATLTQKGTNALLVESQTYDRGLHLYAVTGAESS
jgi:hypothetical protein